MRKFGELSGTHATNENGAHLISVCRSSEEKKIVKYYEERHRLAKSIMKFIGEIVGKLRNIFIEL